MVVAVASLPSIALFAATEARVSICHSCVTAVALVLAALENQITGGNVNQVKAKIILELANGGIDPVVDGILKKRGVLVLPDVLANAGGVTVSYFEWRQNLKNEHWPESAVFAKLKKIMTDSFNEVWQTMEKYQATPRQAALMVGIKRITEAM